MNNFDKHISEQIKSDKLNFEAEVAIKNRLMYHMQLKSVKSEVRRNAIFPSLALLFTGKFLSLKIGSIVAIFIFFMGFQQMNQQSGFIQLTDTVEVNQGPDTLLISVKDSIQFN